MTGSWVEFGPGRKVLHRIGQHIAIAVRSRQRHYQRITLGDDLVRQRGQFRHGISGTDSEGDRLAVRQDGRRAAVAAIGHPEGHGIGPQIRHRRHPGEDGRTVDSTGGKRRRRRKSGYRELQRFLVDVSGPNRQCERVAYNGDLVSDEIQNRRVVLGFDRDHEGIGCGCPGRIAAPVAIVHGGYGQCVVSAVAGARCETEDPRPVRAVRKRHKVRKRIARQGAGCRQSNRIAVGVRTLDNHLEDVSPCDRDVADFCDFRRAVQVQYCDRGRDSGRQGHAGSVTIIGGRERHGILTGGVIINGPTEQRGVRVKAGAGRQAGCRQRDSGRAAFGPDESTVAVADGRHVIRIVRIGGKGQEHYLGPFVHLPVINRIEYRRPVGVQHGQRHGRALRVLAVGYRHRHLVVACLVVGRRPVKQPGIRIEHGARRQQAAQEGHRLAVRVFPVNVEPQPLAFADLPVGWIGQCYATVRGRDEESHGRASLVDAVTDDESQPLVCSG